MRADLVILSNPSVAFFEGRICALGDDARQISAAKTVAGEGLKLEPGWIDAHGHIGLLADSYRFIDVGSARSERETIELLSASGKDREYILGLGFDQHRWSTKEFPRAQSLSEAFPEKPVLVRRVDHHSLWINQAAAKKFAAKNVGMLFGPEADAVWEAVPRPSSREHAENVLQASQALRAQGIVAVHDMCTRQWDLEAYDALGDTLPLRLYCYVYEVPEPQCSNSKVKICGQKFFLDGTFGSRSAWLKEPYTDCPTTHGKAVLDYETTLLAVRRNFKNGQRVALHAIGDAAVHQAVSLIEAAASAEGVDPRLGRIEHAQLMSNADIERVGRQQLFLGVQFVHHHDDAPWLHERIGHRRAESSSPWRRLLQAGAALCGGSDFPISNFTPQKSVQSALSHPTESLTLPQVIEAYGDSAAQAVGERSVLTVGARADVSLWRGKLLVKSITADETRHVDLPAVDALRSLL